MKKTDTLNKVVVITGAGKGIGRAIAEEFASKRFSVVIAEQNTVLGENTERELHEAGYLARHIKTDVSITSQVVALFQTIKNEFGRLDVLINNAGVSEFFDPLEMDEPTWDRILGTNLKGAFFCAREAAKLMKDTGGGSIVNMASTRAIMSEPNSEAYAASKGGLVALTHALAASLSKYKITVNTILPGWIETGSYESLSATDHTQHFSLRVGKPEDIARACLFLSSPDNNFITGTQLVIDGGMTHKMIYE